MSPNILSLPAPIAASAIGALAEQQLRESPYFFLKNLCCEFDGGVLTVRGSVPIPQLRNVAERIVGRIEGVLEVINRVEVYDPAWGAPNGLRVRNAG